MHESLKKLTWKTQSEHESYFEMLFLFAYLNVYFPTFRNTFELCSFVSILSSCLVGRDKFVHLDRQMVQTSLSRAECFFSRDECTFRLRVALLAVHFLSDECDAFIFVYTTALVSNAAHNINAPAVLCDKLTQRRS